MNKNVRNQFKTKYGKEEVDYFNQTRWQSPPQVKSLACTDIMEELIIHEKHKETKFYLTSAI